MTAAIAPKPHLPELFQTWSTRYGRGSVLALVAAATELDCPSESEAHAAKLRVLEQRHIERHGEHALYAEKSDELARDAGRASSPALVQYHTHWDARLRRMARRHPERFRAPGLSPEEVRDALTLALLHAVRNSDGDGEFTLPGKEWGLLVMMAELRALRQRFRLEAESVDFRTLTLAKSEPSQEERWLEHETEVCHSESAAAAVKRLTTSERQWFATLRMAARQGQFFEASDRPNLSAASRILGKDRSSAHRAYREIQVRFQAELRRRE